MLLWTEFLRCLLALRPACTRARTFAWMVLVVAGFAARPDLAGVTSFVRGGWLRAAAYHRLLALFHSSALRLPNLTQAWVRLVLTLFRPVTVGEHLVCLADGCKVPKEGRKMPAVKSLHVESGNNSKPEFIMGHSFQAISLLVHAGLNRMVAVPLASRIHEGIVTCNANRRSLLDKLADLLSEIAAAVPEHPLLLVADAYYASGKLIKPLREAGHHLVTRVRINAVAYRPAPRPSRPRRGRPRLYGPKVHLRRLLRASSLYQAAPSPVYGEKNVVLQYRSLDLLWRPARGLIRFVFVKHPTRGNLILLTTHLELDPLEVIALYGARFKIEVGFKEAKYTIGAQAYHLLDGRHEAHPQGLRQPVPASRVGHLQGPCPAQDGRLPSLRLPGLRRPRPSPAPRRQLQGRSLGELSELDAHHEDERRSQRTRCRGGSPSGPA